MPTKKTRRKREGRNSEASDFVGMQANSGLMNPARIYAVPQGTRYLDPTDLAKLEQAFRLWERASSRADVRISRKRILLIFLLIRYTGARLNEVLALNLRKDIDASKRIVRYRNISGANSSPAREVQISSELMSEIQETLDEPTYAKKAALLLRVDAGHVRRKFYERAVACGFAQDLGSPNAIRRARAVEWMQSNVPLPVVQRVLGHSTPNLTASFIAFSEEDIHQVARHFIETESRRKTSVAECFFRKNQRNTEEHPIRSRTDDGGRRSHNHGDHQEQPEKAGTESRLVGNRGGQSALGCIAKVRDGTVMYCRECVLRVSDQNPSR